jgi:hypothetical protein
MTDSLAAEVFTLSDDIKDFLKDTLDDDQSECVSYYDERNKLYKLCCRSVGSSFNDLRIVADMRTIDQNGIPEWTIDDGLSFSTATQLDNTVYVGSDIIGQAYIDETGLADDDDANIQANWTTKSFTANNPTTNKRYKNVNIFGRMRTTTDITATILVDGQEVTRVTIDSNDLPDLETGGVGTQEIGSEAIADDQGGEDLLQEFTKRIPFRSTGKKIAIRFETDGINQDYLITHIDYSFVALSKLFYTVKETL